MNPTTNRVAEYCAKESSGSNQKNSQHVISNPPGRLRNKNPYSVT
jgi:hypothetical protein